MNNELARSSSLMRPPSHQLNITLVYASLNVKRERDQFCIECGQPFFSISDKIVAIYDGGVTTEYMRGKERTIGLRCKRHTCKQHFQLHV